VPEGDTIRWHANRIRPVLEGRAADEVRPHLRFSRDGWVQRLTGRVVEQVDAYGKHLMLRFEGGLVLHSHLGMVGTWGVYPPGRRWGRSRRRAWLVLRAGETEIVQFDGPTLELVTAGRAGRRPTRRPGSFEWAGPASSGSFDQRLAALGPDVLADVFDAREFLRRLRHDDPTRPIGDALLDQRTVAGVGNMWKAEGCWEAQLDPWRRAGETTDAEALRVLELVRPRMAESAAHGPRVIRARVYGKAGRPCPRCGTAIRAGGQWDDNRITYWCPGCQS
jgi:endonuclease-8